MTSNRTKKLQSLYYLSEEIDQIEESIREMETDLRLFTSKGLQVPALSDEIKSFSNLLDSKKSEYLKVMSSDDKIVIDNEL